MGDEITTEYIGNEALEQQTRAEVDIQIATAKRWPRDVVKVAKEITTIACMDRATAESCFFTLKRKQKEGGVKIIQGPSVRLAEIAVSCYGNIRAVSRVVGNDGKFITAQATCFDVEKNVQVGWEIKRRITDSRGRTYGDDMQTLTANAAAALAFRNAVFKVVPKSLILPAYDAARKTAVGDAKTLGQRRTTAVETFEKMGVAKDLIFAAVGKTNIEGIGLAELEVLIGLYTAIRDGDTTLEEAFPERQTSDLVGDAPTATANSTTVGADAKAEADAGLAPKAPAEPPKSPSDQLADVVTGWGHTFDTFRKWAKNTGNLQNADDLTGFEDLPQDISKRLLRNHKGLKLGLDAVKGGGK